MLSKKIFSIQNLVVIIFMLIPVLSLGQDQSNQAINWQSITEAAKTSVGFFWKAGWAFILGYAISAMIQAFVPKKKLTEKMGGANLESISLSTLFGTMSSSCSFAALASAKSLFLKGAHFICTVAFMFASTNLVIELGILIYIFLGWQFLVAELIGGLVLIAISSIFISLFYPKKWIEQARKRLEDSEMEKDFDWKKRIRSKHGWHIAGNKFVSEWKMAWEDIVIGFTIAGFVSALVPASFWETIFLNNMQNQVPDLLIKVENALVAPFVAAGTFIGSVGNIPLATVLNGNGVLFAGIMGFIYSDLMVPPLVNMNRKYYGTKVALYIAAIMYISIVLTALALNYGFELIHALPEENKKITEVTQFKFDYTFWLNLLFFVIAGWMIQLNRQYKKMQAGHEQHEYEGHQHQHDKSNTLSIKRAIVYIFLVLVATGFTGWLLS